MPSAAPKAAPNASRRSDPSSASSADLREHVARPLAGAAPDDVLDAIVGAWTARRYAGGADLQLGGELDETGLRMEVIA